MNKIICDICGTSYPETSDSCPICGCSRDAAADFLNTEVLDEDLSVEVSETPVSAKKKEIFDFDEVNSARSKNSGSGDDEEEEYDEDEDDDDDAPRSNTFVVILLTILIVALLAAAAFIYFRFFHPNNSEETAPVTIAHQPSETTAEVTEATIPCEHIAMTNAGIAELSAEGQQFLLHIRAIPEDTTDEIIYTSGDESVATVTEDGKITAVAEGETIVYISCGKYSIECPVIVKYVEETVPTTEAVKETVAETVPETTKETKPPVTLKLKKSDIQLGVYYQFQLELDCDLKPEDVKWTSEHPHIAKVDKQGNVTALKDGTTCIIAKYGKQEAKCMVRCVWY